MPSKRLFRVLVTTVLALILLATVRPVPVTRAASLTFTVTSTADAHDATPGDGMCASTLPGGACTLRAAIEEANAQSSGSGITITVPAGRYLLTLGTLSLSANTTSITGAGAGSTVINGQGQEVLSVLALATAMLKGVTITGGVSSQGGGISNAGKLLVTASRIISNTANGSSFGGGGIYNAGSLTLKQTVIISNSATVALDGGGGILNNGGTVAVSDSVVSGNSAVLFGGGIDNLGVLTVSNSTVGSNAASVAGGIRNRDTMTVTNSTLSANIATCSDLCGGGIENDGGTVVLRNSTLISNTTGAEGAGLLNSGTMTVATSTLSGNSALHNGGGIFNQGTLSLTHSTLTSNSAFSGGGIFNYGVMTMTATTLNGNFDRQHRQRQLRQCRGRHRQPTWHDDVAQHHGRQQYVHRRRRWC